MMNVMAVFSGIDPVSSMFSSYILCFYHLMNESRATGQRTEDSTQHKQASAFKFHLFLISFLHPCSDWVMKRCKRCSVWMNRICRTHVLVYVLSRDIDHVFGAGVMPPVHIFIRSDGVRRTTGPSPLLQVKFHFLLCFPLHNSSLKVIYYCMPSVASE